MEARRSKVRLSCARVFHLTGFEANIREFLRSLPKSIYSHLLWIFAFEIIIYLSIYYSSNIENYRQGNSDKILLTQRIPKQVSSLATSL